LDNGPELISQALAEWAAEHGVTLEFIKPGKPMRNGFEDVKTHANNASLENNHSAHDIINTFAFSLMSKSPYMRSGTRRLGDDYQDLIACELFVDWLEHSDRYQWIRVEADEAKFLDDVVVMRGDVRVEVKQVKVSITPEGVEDPFSWEKLLVQSETKSETKTQSLLSPMTG
jgi:hypothetical protein